MLAYCFEAGASALEMLVQTDVDTAHPSASAPAKADNERMKRNRPTRTASQSSLSLAFITTRLSWSERLLADGDCDLVQDGQDQHANCPHRQRNQDFRQRGGVFGHHAHRRGHESGNDQTDALVNPE